jgi:S1-C subfamily serine protease
VPQDFAEAAKRFRLAADQKNAAGESNLGALYAGGRGVPLDHDEAVRLFRLAANQGFAVAQANLGFQYQTGHGVPASPAAAYFWLNLAAAALPANMTALRTRVTQARDVVSGQLAPDELQHVQEMAVSWKPGSTGVPADGVPPGVTQSTSAPIAGAPSGATKARSSGTGFVINHAGFVLTNNHVVGQCSEVRGRHGADPVGVLSVVAKDAQNDLALLKLAAHFPDAAVFREERGVRQGDSIVVYGFPLAGGLAAQGNLTTGTISALAGFGNDSRMLQLTAPVQPGNSGGPVLDAGGNVLGILSGGLDALRIATAVGTLPQNVNFAIKGSVARNFLDANGIDYQIAPIKNELKPADIGDRAKRFTLYIECWR